MNGSVYNMKSYKTKDREFLVVCAKKVLMVAISYKYLKNNYIYRIRMKLKRANYITEVRLYFCPFQEVTVYLCIYFNFNEL